MAHSMGQIAGNRVGISKFSGGGACPQTPLAGLPVMPPPPVKTFLDTPLIDTVCVEYDVLVCVEYDVLACVEYDVLVCVEYDVLACVEYDVPVCVEYDVPVCVWYDVLVFFWCRSHLQQRAVPIALSKSLSHK